jgi:AraC-like DNA-binding protein
MVVGTKFLPGGFAGFLDRPVSQLSDRIVGLPELFDSDGIHLERALADAVGDPDAHLGAVETFLGERLPGPDPRYEIVRAVTAEMLTQPPATTVAALADRHAVSARTLQRLFRDYVGVSPKWVMKRYRMHEAAQRIAGGESDGGARLALDLGYFDQAHFIRDFTEQIGRPPGAYARACAAGAWRRTEALAATAG